MITEELKIAEKELSELCGTFIDYDGTMEHYYSEGYDEKLGRVRELSELCELRPPVGL